MTPFVPPAQMQRTAQTVENVRIAESTYRIRLHCPEIARRIRPGQFVMLRLPGRTDPLLGRPFALYDTSPDQTAIDVVYLVVGKMTNLLQAVAQDEPVEIWGPLGQPFPEFEPTEVVTLVAGGIGQTPFLAYARELLGERGYGGKPPHRRCNRLNLYYGVRRANLVAGIPDFQNAGVSVHLASDDGSIGHRGYVTELLANHGRTSPLVGCGPEPMLHALAKLADQWQVPCWVSLETPMACGVGICFSCVTKVCTPDGQGDYKRVCVDGPVFEASKLVWNHS